MILLTLLASISFAQSIDKSTGTFNETYQQRIDSLEIQLSELRSGRSTTTAFLQDAGSITFTTSGRGICWADGTCQTSAGLSASSTNTFTAAQIFRSSITAGSAVYTSTAVTGLGLFVNSWTVVASTNPSNSISVIFTGLSPNTLYHLWGRITFGSAARFFVRFNNDGGTNYQYGLWAVNQAAFSEAVGSAGDSKCRIEDSAIAGDSSLYPGLYFSTQRSSNSKVRATWLLDKDLGSNNIQATYGSCSYSGAAALSSITIFPDAGNFTGYFYLEQLSVPNP